MAINYWTSLPIQENEFYNSLERNFSIVAMSDIKKYIKRPGRFKLLPDSFIGRWDLVSNQVYDTPNYWWGILAINNIEDPFDPNLQGQSIFYPHILDMVEFLNSSSFARNK